MAVDATGATTPLGIPKFNTASDPPSGKGFNAAMDAIDALFTSRANLTLTQNNKTALQLTGAAAGLTIGGDVTLYRGSAGAAYTDGRVLANMSFATANQVWIGQNIGGTGVSAITLGGDVGLYRSAAGILKTDSVFTPANMLLTRGADLNVNSGAITPTNSFHGLTTTGGTILTTINASFGDGTILFLYNTTGGNISFNSGSNLDTAGVTLASGKLAMLFYKAAISKWALVSFGT